MDISNLDEATLSHLRWLLGKYRAAAAAEMEQKRIYEEARKAYGAAGEKKTTYAEALRMEGFDVKDPSSIAQLEESPENEGGAEVRLPEKLETRINELFKESETSENRPSNTWETPLSSTHAVYLIMRRNGNHPLTPVEIFKYSEGLGYGLQLDDIMKVLHRQMGKGLMARIGDGYAQTPAGEQFNSFRRRSEPEKTEETEYRSVMDSLNAGAPIYK